jgi:dipeptidyl aminopeptidase/acylaminoacyl peptidase
MSRPGRLLTWGSLAALLVLSGCTSAMTGSTTAGRSSAAAPSTGPASARPGRVRLHGRVALASDRRRNVDLDLLELPAGRLRRLTSSPAADLSPTWAPDGGRLAFRSDRDGNDEVYVMNSDGSAVTRLTHADSEEQEPAFMPCTGACP